MLKKKDKRNFAAYLLLFFLLLSLNCFSQSIQVTGVIPDPSCGGGIVTVTFNTTNGNGGNRAYYTSGTNFIAYLSSNTGVGPYTSLGPLTLLPYTFSGGNGTVNSGVQGTIVLPANASGTYKIAVGSTSPFFIATAGSGASPNFTVNAAPNGGTLSGNAVVCPGVNSATFTLSSYTGSIVKWQSSPLSDFSVSVTDIPNLSANLTVNNVSTTTYYRVVLTNGTCSAFSSVASVTVDPSPGTVSGDQSICAGTQPADIVLSGNSGTIQWQQSTDNVSFSNIAGANGATLTSAQMGTPALTTYYRAQLTGGCGVIYSATVTVVVNQSSVGGTVLSDATICSGNNSTTLTLTGYTGNVVKWQSSTQLNFNTAVDINNTTNTLVVTDLTSTTYYRAVVKNGGCAQVNSSRVKLTVINAPNGGTLSGGTTVCYGVNSTTLTLTGYTNTIQKWQSSTISDFSSGVTDIANTTATLTVTNLTVTTYYRVVVVNANCSSFSTIAAIQVNPMLTATIIGNNSPICIGSNAVFNLTGSTGATVTYTINGGANQTVVLTGGLAAVTVNAPVSDQTLNLVSVSFGACTQTISGSSTVVVGASNVWTGSVDNQWGTTGNWSCGTLPTANTDVIINSGAVVVSGINALANTLSLNGTSTLTVNSGNNITVTNAVTVGSGANMTLQNNANLIQINNVANSGSIVVNRESSSLMRLDYTLWSSPVASQNLLAFSPLTVTNRFYVYNSVTNLYSAVTPSSTNFQLGKGYLIRMPDNHPTTPVRWGGVFTGVPNNGNVSFSAYNGGAGLGFNGVGNPYPSPVDMTSFVNGNAGNITGTLYFWRKTNSAATDPGYCTWTTAGFVGNGEAQVVNPNGILRTGQGFIVEMSNGATNVSFTNAMRVANNADQFFRNSDLSEIRELQGDRIWLNVDNASGANNQMLLGYFPSATLGVDFGIDGKSFEDGPVSLTMDIAGGNYLIQGKPVFDVSDSTPLRLKTSYTGMHSISIDHLDGVFLDSQNIYLKDNLLNVTHDLKASAYSFACNSGTFPNRFEIVYQTVLNVNQSNFDGNTVVVYKDEQGDMNINASGVLIDTVEVYDVRGRKLIRKVGVNNPSALISNLKDENAVLFVKVISEDGRIVNKKIVF
ncbi:MAG TPA: T9SS sorting signal type C domain-containing protein [Flavobacterium sp.]|uniref:T9SS sorting signal type C domain-containing protein n=1 Tax=Flavobacterium sp. TaxID=239 RepID=UPI002BB9B616|nr:T9SS sorting signal type C domain-containing protein [Flavobacterium sp.]HSD13482.1 T9SS sorting signal type C domain-containing protein [Flavobacterium sp.]